MAKDLIKEYNNISKRIAQETETYMGQLISNLVDEKKKSEGKSWIEHEIAMLSMRSFRIFLACKLLDSDFLENKDTLIQDIEFTLKSVESIKYKGQIDEEVVSDAVDCIASFCTSDEDREIIIKFVSEQYPKIKLPGNMFSSQLYYLLNNMAEYFFREINDSVAITILWSVLLFSRIRNGVMSNKHRETVVRILARLGDDYPEESYKICFTEKGCFKNTNDEFTGDFLWFYGCVLQRKNKIESARKKFIACYKIRLSIYGETNWYTAMARREYMVLSLISSDNIKNDGIKYLEIFINRIEEGAYSDIQREFLDIIEGKTLYSLLSYRLNTNNLYSFCHYLNIFERICSCYNDNIDEPLIKTRLAKNLYGGYCLKVGDYIQAEQAFREALNVPFSNGTCEIITEAQIKSNLLMVYYVENDIEQAVPILMELLDLIDNTPSGLSKKDEYRVYILYCSLVLQSFMDCDEEELDDLKEVLSESQNDIMQNNALDYEYARELSMFVLVLILLLIQNDQISLEDDNDLTKMIIMIKDESDRLDLDNGQKVIMYLVLSILAWEIDEQSAEDYITKCVSLSNDAIVPLSTKAVVLQTAGTILSKLGKYSIALRYLNHALRQITNIWHSYVRYFNDSRLLQILSPTQLIFSCCYAVMRDQSRLPSLYEKVLQYKALASLAGKERNRVLHSNNVDCGLTQRIKMVQNRIATLESENIFQNVSKEYELEAEYLRSLEAEFARQFPTDINFMEITYDKVQKAIPDNSLLVEFILCSGQYGEHQHNILETDILVFDVFIIRKENNLCSLQKITISNAEQIIDKVEEFVRILQAESRKQASISQIEQKELLRLSLYNLLIEPLKMYISGIRRMYLAPDSSIMNLPFEILTNEYGEQFGDSFNIVKMECARDFLFSNYDSPKGCGSLIVGNPEYEIREKKISWEDHQNNFEGTRFVSLKTENIHQLPFSELEVQLVGKYCKTAFNIGKTASKSLLFEAENCGNIHLATHGFYDLSEDTDAIYSSCLLFAGVKNWLNTGNENEIYGNGIITADEISRMNFTGVELVVLSSCLGGMNETVLAKGYQGLIGGFSAAGVKYVISNLWSADDFGTAVLMDAFYYQYRIKGIDPPAALRKAKQYLRKVTVGDLKKRKWFEYILRSKSVDDATKKAVEGYAGRNEKFKPFKNEIYWAGFVCFRCN